MAITITRTGVNTVITQTGLPNISISASTEVEITYNDAEEFINILLVASTEPPIVLEVADFTTVNGVNVTAYTIAQLAAYISANCFGVFNEVTGDFEATGKIIGAEGKFGAAGNNATLEVRANSGEAFRADVAGGAYRIVATQTGVLMQGQLNFAGLPTSAAGLNAGDLWNDGGTIKIV